ncbi:Zinc finger HIT domain-containing protein 1 [Oopsacas minuta]|uniref:Zinc finger HIT domain-containing protein 1 n=1 Tax=Oopsacas minuta TaxID=111878 RepID=A0AAV7KJG0_9METZ|nr:Zinc finger HIT domain-containing protein 1 [Oopsacas minuta]
MEEIKEIKPKQKSRSDIRILDSVTRQRRKDIHLESLEKDNFVDDESIQMSAGKQTIKEMVKKRKKVKTGEHYKKRFRKNFSSLLEEIEFQTDQPNYFTAKAPKSILPKRKFCAVCGFPSCYNCVVCGGVYCTIECQLTHKETRCNKWVV